MEQQKKQSNLLELVDACETYHFNNGDPDDDIRLLKAQELRELGFTAKADELEKELNRKIKLSRIENEKYIAISDEMIQKFLNKKAERYDADHKPKLNVREDEAPPEMFSTLIHDSIRRASQTFLDQFYQTPPDLVENPYSMDVQESGRASQLRQELQRYRAELQERLWRQQMQAQQNRISSFYSIDPMSGFRNLLLGASSSTFIAKTCDFLSTEEGTIGKYEWTEEKISDYKGIPPEDVLEVLKEHKDKQLFDYFTIASVNAVKDPLLLGRIEGVKERFFIAQWGIDVSLDDIL